jgi:hypothetical protein
MERSKMAGISLAQEWLATKSVGHTEHERARALMKKIEGRHHPHFFCEHDKRAWAALLVAEACPSKTLPGRVRGKRKKQYSLPKLIGMSFIVNALRSATDDCVFMPFANFRTASRVYFNGGSDFAARVMCRKAHGEPSHPDFVARHLCGNGHMSCVNPRHLAWGTQEQNALDKEIHYGRPRLAVKLSPDEIEAIAEDGRHPNVLAVRLGIPSVVIMSVKSGTYIT